MPATLQLPFPLTDDGPGPYRVLLAGRRALARDTRASLQDPAAAQQRRLEVILGHVAATAFGREHGLSAVRTPADLAAAVPVRTHAQLKPWLDRVAAGEAGVLSREPVDMLVETSGTTGSPKHLPVTAPWADSVARAQELWLLGMVRDHPGVTRGKALSMVSAAQHATSPGGIPIGSNTGRMLGAQPWYVRLRYPVPAEVFALSPSSLKLYVVLCLALPAAITSLTTANPSTVLLMARRLAEWREALTADILDGTFRHGPAADLDPAMRRRLEKPLRRLPGPLRRRRLPRGDWSLQGLWPLQLVNCWTAGPAAYFAGLLREQLGPGVAVRPVGVTASEGYFAVPLAGDWPGGVLHIDGHLLELADDSGAVRPAWQAQQGERLRLIITTEAGLVRYDMGDIVEVVGRCERTPVVRFVGKAGRYLNVVGERVTEGQLSAAVDQVRRTHGLRPVGFTARVLPAELPAYELAVEGLDAARARAWAAAFDAALKDVNVEYGGKRGSDRLLPPTTRLLPDGSYLRWRMRRVAAGASDGQVKDPLMAVDQAEWQALLDAAGPTTVEPS